MGKTAGNLARGTWQATTESIQARKGLLQNAEGLPRLFWKLGFWVVSWIFSPTILNIDYYVEKREGKKNI